MERILTTYAGDVAMVPVIWYFPLAARDPSWMDRVPDPAGGNRLTVREYQQRWLEVLATEQAELNGTVVGQPELAAISVLTAIPEPADPFNVDAGTVSAATMALAARSAPPAELPAHGAGSMRSIVFPVLGPVTYQDGWGDCRDGCRRRHQGTDIIGVRMQPLLAAVDGTVTRIRYDNLGTAGAIVTLTDADGWSYNYFHVNNDTPGSDEATAQPAWQVAPRLAVGDQVTAGQVIGYMGDSGNSESSVPHLHFEIRDPTGTAQPSFWSLEAAKARQACTIGIGPWSAAGPPAPAGTTDQPVQVTAVRPLFGDGSWLIDTDGRVTATGDAALIVPGEDLHCEAGPTTPFGTDGAGWTTAADTRILESTTLAGVDPALPAPAFHEPSSGETILISAAPIVAAASPDQSQSTSAWLAV